MEQYIQVHFDPKDAVELFKLTQQARPIVMKHQVTAWQSIKSYAVEIARTDLLANLKVRRPAVAKAITGKASDGRAKNLLQLFATVYTRSGFVESHDKGGTIAGHGKQLTILFGAGRGSGGKRRYSAKELRNRIAARQIRMVPTPHGVLLVENGTMSKAGNFRGGKINKSKKGFTTAIIGKLVRSVVLKKRTHFYQTEKKVAPIASQLIEEATEKALNEIAGN